MPLRNSSLSALRCLIVCGAAAIAAPAQSAAGPADSDTAAISGAVTNSVTGAPIPRAHITLRSYGATPARLFGAMSDGEGKFHMLKLPPGRYLVAVEHVGFMTPPNQPASLADITLAAADKRDDFKLTMAPTGAVGGRVLDAAGEPMPGITVTAEGSGGSLTASTDENGRFRVGGLRPGKYRVKASAQTSMPINPLPPEIRTDGSTEYHYSPTFYPAALTEREASRIDVQPGAEVAGLEIRMVRTPIVSVSGRITGPGRNAIMGVEAAPSNEGSGTVSITMPKPDGTFTFWRLDPGKYTLITAGPNASAPVEIEVGAANLERIEIRTVPPSDIAVKLRFEDQDAGQPAAPASRPGEPPPPPRRVTLQAMTAGRVFDAPTADIGTNDSVTLEKVQPGLYRARISGLPAAYVKSIRVGSAETQGDVLDVRNGIAGPVEMAISTNVCQVRGTVKDANGPLAGVRVALAQPVESGLPNPYVTVTTGADGSFLFPAMAPGAYELMAVDDDALASIRRGLTPDRFAEVGEKLDLSAGDKASRDLRWQ